MWLLFNASGVKLLLNASGVWLLWYDNEGRMGCIIEHTVAGGVMAIMVVGVLASWDSSPRMDSASYSIVFLSIDL